MIGNFIIDFLTILIFPVIVILRLLGFLLAYIYYSIKAGWDFYKDLPR